MKKKLSAFDLQWKVFNHDEALDFILSLKKDDHMIDQI